MFSSRISLPPERKKSVQPAAISGAGRLGEVAGGPCHISNVIQRQAPCQPDQLVGHRFELFHQGPCFERPTATVAKGRKDIDWAGFAREVSEGAGL
jgi:hypothetical protein